MLARRKATFFETLGDLSLPIEMGKMIEGLSLIGINASSEMDLPSQAQETISEIITSGSFEKLNSIEYESLSADDKNLYLQAVGLTMSSNIADQSYLDQVQFSESEIMNLDLNLRHLFFKSYLDSGRL